MFLGIALLLYHFETKLITFFCIFFSFNESSEVKEGSISSNGSVGSDITLKLHGNVQLVKIGGSLLTLISLSIVILFLIGISG